MGTTEKDRDEETVREREREYTWKKERYRETGDRESQRENLQKCAFCTCLLENTQTAERYVRPKLKSVIKICFYKQPQLNLFWISQYSPFIF